MSDNEKKLNAAQVRLLVVMEILSGNEVSGICLRDITEALASANCQVSNSTVLHDLETLESRGWAERLTAPNDKNWRLSAKPYQLFTNLTWGLQKASRQIADVQQNYTRLPN